jgi:hypothetical protein
MERPQNLPNFVVSSPRVEATDRLHLSQENTLLAPSEGLQLLLHTHELISRTIGEK